MADIEIERIHSLGLSQARKVALQWAAQAEEEFELTCRYEEGPHNDLLSFSRAGFEGTLTVTPERFDLSARLSFVLSMFKESIEAKILRKLDALTQASSDAPASAFDPQA